MKGVKLIKKPSLIRVKKRETPIQVYSCDTCEIFKNIYLGEHLWTTASKSEYITQKTIHLFLSQNYDFHNYDYNLWGSEVSSVLCEVIVFADIFYKNFHSFFFLTLFFRTKRWNFSSRKQKDRNTQLQQTAVFRFPSSILAVTGKWDFQFSKFCNINRALEPNIPGFKYVAMI